MAETRLPEQMPTKWSVKAFSHERGFGTLIVAMRPDTFAVLVKGGYLAAA